MPGVHDTMQRMLHETHMAIPSSGEVMQVPEWLLLVYRVPTEPSSARSAIWREVRRLGALSAVMATAIREG